MGVKKDLASNVQNQIVWLYSLGFFLTPWKCHKKNTVQNTVSFNLGDTDFADEPYNEDLAEMQVLWS